MKNEDRTYRYVRKDYEIDLPDEWITVSGMTEELSGIYDKVYKDGALLYEIEEFDDEETT